MGYQIDFGSVVIWMPLLFTGLQMTAWISGSVMLLTMIVALPIALLRMSRNAPLNIAANGFIGLTRSIPLFVFLLWLFYGLPLFVPVTLSPIAAGVITLVVQFASFQAEAYRSGLIAVTRGQKEAALAVGLSRLQVFRYITAPQALRVATPPTINNLIAVFKSTSVLSVIGVVEVSRVVVGTVGITGRVLEMYTALVVIYIVGVGLLSLLGVWYERSTNIPRLAAAGEKKRAIALRRAAATS